MPSRPSLQAWRNTVSPSPSMCSLNRMPGPALAKIISSVTLRPSSGSFDRVRYRHHDESIFLYAFDLIELNGDDLRSDPLEGRKGTLEITLAKAGIGIRFNEHIEGDG